MLLTETCCFFFRFTYKQFLGYNSLFDFLVNQIRCKMRIKSQNSLLMANQFRSNRFRFLRKFRRTTILHYSIKNIQLIVSLFVEKTWAKLSLITRVQKRGFYAQLSGAAANIFPPRCNKRSEKLLTRSGI